MGKSKFYPLSVASTEPEERYYVVNLVKMELEEGPFDTRQEAWEAMVDAAFSNLQERSSRHHKHACYEEWMKWAQKYVCDKSSLEEEPEPDEE